MEKKILFVIAILQIVGCGSSASKLNLPESSSAVWEVYEGSLPCADCSEIKTRLEIFIDNGHAEPPFIIKQAYLGKKDGDQAVIDHGVYGTVKGSYRGSDLTVYELNPDKPTKKMFFLRVHADTLRMVDQNLNEIKTEL
ncbi:MAG: copper resistance protein NlpE N-terminal domain-containing protein, partial [Bacteroidota bacterium]